MSAGGFSRASTDWVACLEGESFLTGRTDRYGLEKSYLLSGELSSKNAAIAEEVSVCLTRRSGLISDFSALDLRVIVSSLGDA